VDHEQQPEPRPRFDPQAALQELERFGQDIQRYRAQREALGDEFESFVRSFKTPPADPGGDPPIAPRREAAAPPSPATARSLDSRGTPEPANSATPEPVSGAEPENVRTAEPLSTPASPPARATTPVAALAAGAALLVGGALLAAFLWNRSPEPAADGAATADVPSAAAPAPPPEPAPVPAAAATTAPAPAPPAERGSETAIVTERQVWMRVTVDGERVLEREVPAGTRIPLRAEKTIVIRTGDAGAVRLSIRGGTSTLLGREGEVVTRSFTVPPRSEAAR
jgi:hypothetical protein